MKLDVFLCGQGAPADVLRTLVGLAGCCYDAAEFGPDACTCWEPEFDLEQQEPITELAFDGLDGDGFPLVGSVALATRSTMCEDCAFRPDSPERSGDPNYAHAVDDGGLPDVPTGGEFWCHQGMRKPVRWRHPLGITVECSTDHYRPPMLNASGRAIPFKADGTPGERCAGWAAHRRSEGQVIASFAEQPS